MSSVDKRIAQLQANGIVDLHFDLLMDLYGKRDRSDVLVTDFLPEFKAGDVDVLAAAIYIEDQYLPDRALAVGLGQIARLYVERDRSDCFVICKSFSEIRRAREQGKIALLIAMEGIEPIGADLDLLRIFYELGVRVIGLTHAGIQGDKRCRRHVAPRRSGLQLAQDLHRIFGSSKRRVHLPQET